MTVGFIGCGNMARAMMGGMIRRGLLAAENIIGTDVNEAVAKEAERDYGIRAVSGNGEAAGQSDILILAVKPQYYEPVIEEIREKLRRDTLIVTIAPGISLHWMEEKLGFPAKLIRTMPNTPALVNEGMTAACCGSSVIPEEFAVVKGLFESFGKVEVIPEHLMDGAVSVSGSSPAYVFLMIEAMADAAVADGIPRAQACIFAAQAVYGSAKMVLETGMHPGQLKDMVCSPAGTTIEAVRALEEKGFRGCVMAGMKACTEKAGRMSQK